MTYDAKQIAKELTATALGTAYYGNALRVAKDIPVLNDVDRSLLDKWSTGTNVATDSWALQCVAMKIESAYA